MRLVKQLTLKFGAAAGDPPLQLQPTGVTLFVGPNNAGKSLALREIERYCALEQRAGNHIVDTIEFNFPDAATILADLNIRKTEPNQNEAVPDGHILVQRINTFQGLRAREIIPFTNMEEWVKTRNSHLLTRYYISLLTIRLDGATRTTLLNAANRTDLLAPPTNLLSNLFVDTDARYKIRQITYDAFGSYFTIDALNASQLRVRLSPRLPVDEAEEQALDHRAREFHRGSREIVDASDGVKAFTGMVASVLGQNCKIPLIDEPEAFLHPPLARRLGKELAESAHRLQASAFIATHSSHFLMGCVSGNPQINIVRLTYKGGQPTARLLTHDKLQDIIKSPLMRSTGVLSALFHEGAVICEGDSDRALYEEINSRLSTVNQSTAADAIFLNAHTKQSTAKIAGPLRKMGIPAALVIDFDIFNDTDDFKNLLKDVNITPSLASGWCQTKSILSQQLIQSGVDFKKSGLLAVKNPETIDGLKSMMSSLSQYGIFVVPNGELESWLSSLGVNVTSNKRYWLTSIFDALGDDPSSPTYLQPTTDDIWKFMLDIAAWINNPNRQGIA